MPQPPPQLAVPLCIAIALSSAVAVEQRGQKPPAAPTAGDLAIEVGLVMQSGDVRRVPRTEFYLMRRSAGQLVLEVNKSAGVTDAPTEEGQEVQALGVFAIRVHPSNTPIMKRHATTILQYYSAIKQHSVQIVQTDFDGKAHFSDVPAGEYWIFGIYCWQGGGFNFAVWDVPVSIAPGQTTALILDQNNTVSERRSAEAPSPLEASSGRSATLGVLLPSFSTRE